jgi:hypothetical protein
MQVIFPGANGTAVDLTTETLILSNTYPVGPCAGEAACVGQLVWVKSINTSCLELEKYNIKIKLCATDVLFFN